MGNINYGTDGDDQQCSSSRMYIVWYDKMANQDWVWVNILQRAWPCKSMHIYDDRERMFISLRVILCWIYILVAILFHLHILRHYWTFAISFLLMQQLWYTYNVLNRDEMFLYHTKNIVKSYVIYLHDTFCNDIIQLPCGLQILYFVC